MYFKSSISTQILILICGNISAGLKNSLEPEWNSAWFPHIPGASDDLPPFDYGTRDNQDHRIQMGVRRDDCDNAKDNLNVDWDMSPINYTCFNDQSLYLPKQDVHPIHTTEHIPVKYQALHKCMNESIEYSTVIPTFGTHRPLWARYGEYIFVPKQRWIHNLEHGAIVMLYHPCANGNEVNILRNIVGRCLTKHVITPYNLLSPERPLALVAWGHSLEMPRASKELAHKFIQKYALRGPETIPRDGQYDLGLLQSANWNNDVDSITCGASRGFE